MEDDKYKDIQKKTYKLNGKPRLSGYSFLYDDEEYLCVKKINANESREEGNYNLMKVIRGLDDQVRLSIINKNDPTNVLWTKVIDSLEESYEKH